MDAGGLRTVVGPNFDGSAVAEYELKGARCLTVPDVSFDMISLLPSTQPPSLDANLDIETKSGLDIEYAVSQFIG